MANLTETNAWSDGIYQLETEDEVMGGENGIDNLQAKQLGARTQWLKKQLDNVISAAGLTPDKTKLDQLAEAIAKAASGGKVLGQPFWHQGTTPPVDAMEFKQQILNRVTYSKLFNALQDADRNIDWVTQAEASSRPGCWHTGDGSSTFGVPSMADEFIRVFDSAGADDRPMGTHQNNQNKAHHHLIYPGNYGGSSSTSFDVEGMHGASSVSPKNTSSEGGDEARPDNTAWMLCFYYQ